MKRLLLPILFFPLFLGAQVSDKLAQIQPVLYPELVSMSAYDSLMLARLPEFMPEETVLRRLIPYAVDNSTKPWFRPLVAQVGLECGQSSSVGIMFTYEMDYKRQLPANVPENQYTTHFTYNFINGGSNAGISFYESFEIIKKAGNPTVAEYGGMAPGGASMWMTGYDKYYSAMHNRVNEIYSIKVNTAEGIQTLKNWIFDHANGSTAGGLGCFYAEFTNPPVVFPSGVPEAGKHVLTSWGNSANHAMTICGYNDSIRWDYNQDGQYTNTIDLNGDGIIDPRDWEIGGFKMANTYGSVTNWGDQGFAYMMYKSVADVFGQGGIWNNAVVIADVKDNHQPKLTAKIALSHNCRNKLRVSVGVSSNPQATMPDKILYFPVFDFQGGCQPMQGNGYPENIEFGLDLNPLLAYMQPDTETKFFLRIDENDPQGEGSGVLTAFSLMEYTQGLGEINSGVNNLTIIDNGLTTATVNASVHFDPPVILNDDLPPQQLYTAYSTQLEADGGTLPYKWAFAEDYTRFDSVSVMPEITTQKLALSSNNGSARVVLPFPFYYFGKEYHEIYATSEGYLIFEKTLLPWPYYIEGRTYFMEKPMIAPSMSNPYFIGSPDDGVWYEAAENHVTFRWKLSIYETSGTINATAKLYKDGRIEFNYGEFVVPSYVKRFSGISAGDGQNYVLLSNNSNYMPGLNQFIRFSPTRTHQGIELSKNGLLTATSLETPKDIPLRISITDKNNLRTYKTFILASEGLQMDYSITSGDDDTIEFGETFTLDLNITNLNSFAIHETEFNLSTLDPEFTIIENLVNIAQLLPGESIIIEDAFTVSANIMVPDNHNGAFTLQAESNEGEWSRAINLPAYRPEFLVGNLEIMDGNNGILEPGESALINLTVANIGGAKLMNAAAMLQTWDPFLTITGMEQNRDTILAGEAWNISYNLGLSPLTPPNHTLLINLKISGHNQYNFVKTIPLLTGITVENYETGLMNGFDWQTGGNAGWFVEEGSAWEGNFCARSGLIYDNQASGMWLTWDVAFADSISFWYNVSSETNYDFLHFSMNDEEKERWSGNTGWKFAHYAAEAGTQIFKWQYTKDYSVSNGDDCARVDFILLPTYAVATNLDQPDQDLASFSAYPNPFSGELTITYNLKSTSHVKLSICDALGRVLQQQDYAQPFVAGQYQWKPGIDFDQSGIYLIILETDTDKYVKKLIRTGNH
jgi:hypothetical protein